MKKAIIDIDGVLNNYPLTQINFFNDKLGTQFKTLNEIKNTLSYNKYKQLKSEYRISEYKSDARVNEGAVELINLLKQQGYFVCIITSRQLFIENQLENTVNWLRKNNIYYDYIYSSIKKDFTIFEKFGHIDFAIEDNVNNIENIKRINGENALYFNVINTENECKECSCIRVKSLYEVINYLKGNVA